MMLIRACIVMESMALILLCAYFFSRPLNADAQATSSGPFVATTSLTLSICGNGLVDDGEQCDNPGDTGAYSTTIAGRQCTNQCNWAPYCGDGILQTLYGEECDDGNNADGDFCSSDCTIEPAGSGGGGTSGGGSSSSGGANTKLGDTQVSVTGIGYPNQTVHILMDSKEIGTVRANTDGKFTFASNASPGTVSMGFWSSDSKGTKSITYNTTFDVTQGAITNVNSVIVPPTIAVDKASFNPGDTINFSGQSAPNASIEVHIDNSSKVLTTTATAQGTWSVAYPTAGISAQTHTARARTIITSGALASQSSFSTTLQLQAGVNGKAATPSDLNKDGSVNLIDFSILIFWWNTAGGDSNPPADINGNGNVGLEDFSILLYNWSG